MSENITGSGVVVRVMASVTFPTGFFVTQFADDADPIDLPSVQIADKAMGVNGDLITWSKAVAKEVTLNVIPGSADDINLNLLGLMNTPGIGRVPAQDVITIVVIYPSGDKVTCTGGSMTDYMPGASVASAGRLKTKAYKFAFEDII